jgi:hypothetical protein
MIESKTHENPRNFSFPSRYTLVQQAGKMNIKKSGIFTRIGRIRRLVVRRLVAFRDWSHFRKFGDWSFGDWRSKIGRLEIGCSEIGRSENGRSENGRSENGRSENGQCTVPDL